MERTVVLPLFPSFDHNEVVSKWSFGIANVWFAGGAGFQVKGDLLELGMETAFCLPTERTSLSRLVFREVSGYLIKSRPSVDFRESFFFLRELFALYRSSEPG